MNSFDQFIYEEMQSDRIEMAPLYKIYISEMRGMIHELNAAAKADSNESFARLLHNVKGINANMRIAQLARTAAAISQALASGETVDLREAQERLQHEFELVHTQIQAYFASTDCTID